MTEAEVADRRDQERRRSASVDEIAADTAAALVARLSEGVSEAEALAAVAEVKGRV